MMRLVYFLISFISIGTLSHGQEIRFSELSVDHIPELYFAAPSDGKVMLNLSLKCEKYPVHLALESIYGQDTLIDYISINNPQQHTIKEIGMAWEENVTFKLYSNNLTASDLVGVFGIMEVQFSRALDSNIINHHYKELQGSIWDYDNPIVLNVVKEKENREQLDIRIGLNHNYPYDSLFVKMKLITPSRTIEEDQSFYIQGAERNKYGRIIHLDTKKSTSISRGHFKIILTHQLANQYLNGVDFISWGWIEK